MRCSGLWSLGHLSLRKHYTEQYDQIHQVSEQNGRTVTVECRSVNHRYLDLSLRLPFALSSFEMPIRQLFKDELSRGRVDIFVTVTTDESVPRNIAVDEALALGYTEAVKRLEHIAKRETRPCRTLAVSAAFLQRELTEDQRRLKVNYRSAVSAIEALKPHVALKGVTGDGS